jgi:hypothetical protein
VGTQVRYVRVVFAGEDRGKVDFFTTRHDGKNLKFNRRVRGDCKVEYASTDGTLTLDSGLLDRRCVEAP